MACIGDEKRVTLPIKAQPEVGPGSYDVGKQSPIKAGYAPFFSLQPKFAATNNNKPTENKVGPGKYS